MAEKASKSGFPATPGKNIESPSDSREGLARNLGGMPPTMTVEEIFKANEPPDYPAKNSVETRGSNKDGD
jgi:hypothetical protein